MFPSRSNYLSPALMHLSFLLSGASTMLLGPTLPVFAQQWRLNDSQCGLLIAAQFLGLFVGAIALFHNLRLTLLCGYVLAVAALISLAIASNHPSGEIFGVLSFFLLGVGLGQITTTVNLLSAVSIHASQQRSATLSLLNFTWSAGAVLSPLLAGLYLVHGALFSLLLTFAGLAAALFVALIASVPRISAMPPTRVEAAKSHVKLSFATLFYFFLLFLLYGGLEATLGSWLSIYALRYAALGVAAAAYCTTTLWAAFAMGRVSAAVLLKFLDEGAVRAGGLVLALLATIALRGTHRGLGLGLCASFIGLGIAPFFPVTFSLLVDQQPTPRQAGAATSNIGLGSAIFGFLTGIVATRAGSLHTAMLTPIALAVVLLVLCCFRPVRTTAKQP